MNGSEAMKDDSVRNTRRTKMLISGSLTILAAVLALAARRPWNGVAALAMAVSSMGDGLLAGYPGCFRAVRDRLIKGGAIFLIAHWLYILALVLASGREFGQLLSGFWLPAFVFTVLTLLIGCLFVTRSSARHPRSFIAAAMVYLLTVGLHCAMAVCVFRETDGHFALNVAGALLFYLSDTILLSRQFMVIGEKYGDALIWLTYVPAQFCLILGFFLA